MFDEHLIPKNIENWGIMPVIKLFGFSIGTYTIFIVLAFLSAFICFKLTADKKTPDDRMNRKMIIIFALLGGIIGAKIPILVMNYKLLLTYPQNLYLVFYGKTIVGGLI